MIRIAAFVTTIVFSFLLAANAQEKIISYSEFVYNLKDKKINDAKIVLIIPGNPQAIQIEGHLIDGKVFETTFPADQGC